MTIPHPPPRHLEGIQSSVYELQQTLSIITRTSKLKHDLIEHSSFAVAVSSEGNKHLFFQEQSGIIRQVYRNNLQNSWHASTDFVVALNAKNSTPMSALSLSNITLSGTDNRIGDFVSPYL